jgi:hypothetical protein
MNEIRFFLSPDEYFAAEYYLKRHADTFAPERIGGITLVLIGVTIWMFGGSGMFAIGGILLGTLIFIGMPFFRRWSLRRRWAIEPLHHAEHFVTFMEDGVHYEQDRFISDFPWHFYERVLEKEDAFLLICSADVFNLVPKRAFESPQAVNEFRALARKKLRRSHLLDASQQLPPQK